MYHSGRQVRAGDSKGQEEEEQHRLRRSHRRGGWTIGRIRNRGNQGVVAAQVKDQDRAGGPRRNGISDGCRVQGGVQTGTTRDTFKQFEGEERRRGSG